MSVPEEIRAVPRPKNTVVIASGKGYRVRQRTGCKYVDGRRVPVEGGYVGSIIDGKFVPDDPIKKTGSTGRVDIKNYGRVMYCDILNRDILNMLAPFYNSSESAMIYAIAMIRACYPGTRDYQILNRYRESFVSEMYPNLNMGKNAVSVEQRNLGLEYSRIRNFMNARVCSMNDNDTIIIDGCLIQNHSGIDTFSQISRKTKARKHKDSLMIYAYSEDLREPVCSKLYQGNMVDSRVIGDFLGTNGISKGLIVTDKGFTAEMVTEATEGKKGLHYLVPLKRNSLLISDNNMYDFDGAFFDEERIEFKKVLCDGFWLYSFRNLSIAKDEEESYLEEHTGCVNPKELNDARRGFGTLVFQCDMDISPSKVYLIYQNRWLIELLFKFYQTEMDLDDTRVHDDYSDIGSAFIDFLAALMGSRLLNAFGDCTDMEYWTFKSSMDFLDRLKMVRIGDENDWEMNRLPATDAELFAKLGLIGKPIVPVEIKKKGRPKGRKDTVTRKTRSDKGSKRKSVA